eukprot:2484187-Prymnesium_polylepis.1
MACVTAQPRAPQRWMCTRARRFRCRRRCRPSRPNRPRRRCFSRSTTSTWASTRARLGCTAPRRWGMVGQPGRATCAPRSHAVPLHAVTKPVEGVLPLAAS